MLPNADQDSNHDSTQEGEQNGDFNEEKYYEMKAESAYYEIGDLHAIDMFENYLLPSLDSNKLLKDTVFYATETTKLSEIKHFDDAANLGITLMDLIVARTVSKKYKIDVEFFSNSSSSPLNKADYRQAFFVLTFNLMTRAKGRVDENEEIPRFCKMWGKVSMDSNHYNNIVGICRLPDAKHTWIKDIFCRINLPVELYDRLRLGAAGARFINILVSYNPIINHSNDLTSDQMLAIEAREMIVKHFKGKYFLEQHPFFQVKEIRQAKFSKSCMGLIRALYSKSEIDTMVKRRDLFSSDLQEFDGWKSINSNFLRFFRTECFTSFQDNSNSVVG